MKGLSLELNKVIADNRETFLRLIFIISLTFISCSSLNKNPEYTDIEDLLGIKISGLRLSAEGYMIDFRYKVIDPVKARPLFESGVKPFIEDQKTGSRFFVPNSPKIGPLRQMPRFPESGKVYFILFANPGKFLKHGDTVSVIIGKFRIENIKIE